ncbi:MAG: T9SS type A sorting domain-containing protein [Syntrophothermus sp.]
MKKFILFLFTVLVSFSVKAQLGPNDCKDIIISEYVEGYNNNKSMELYNPTLQPITLDGTYQLIRWSNGDPLANNDIHYVLPLTGTIQPFGVMVMIQDTVPAGQDTMVWPGLRAKGTWLAPYDYDGSTPGGRVVFWNGDDAISLQKKINGTWTDIDIFGEIGVRPLNWQGGISPVGAWTDTPPYWKGTGRYLTKSKTLVRKPGVLHGVDRATMNTYGQTSTGNDPNSFFALAEYDSLPANTFDSLGQHTCNCRSILGVGKIQTSAKVSIFPNPVTQDHFVVETSVPMENLEVISMLGQTVITNIGSSKNSLRVNTANWQPGVYFVKIKFSESLTVTRKIAVQ